MVRHKKQKGVSYLGGVQSIGERIQKLSKISNPPASWYIPKAGGLFTGFYPIIYFPELTGVSTTLPL